MIDLCGTRMRMFEVPLRMGKVHSLAKAGTLKAIPSITPEAPATTQAATTNVVPIRPITVADFFSSALSSASSDLDADLDRLDPEEQKQLKAVWERLWAGQEPSPMWSDLQALTDSPAELSSSLFVDLFRKLSFQSLVHRHAWGERRTRDKEY
jgi:hypothetical protein